jgi:hypothetical protein
MDTKELYIELAKYAYLKDIEEYCDDYRAKFNTSMRVVMDSILSSLIDDEIAGE